MPFGGRFDDCYKRILKPAVESVGLKCKRADEIYGTRRIITDIWDSIWRAKIIIADLTKKNPNVNYELGLCHALGVPTVLITQIEKHVPSDYRDHRYIHYKPKEAGWERKLKRQLRQTVEEALKPSGRDPDLPWPQHAKLIRRPPGLVKSSMLRTVRTAALETPRVPFSEGQNADFLGEIVPREARGFKLIINMPENPYWRVGFVLAPEDYIRDGRSDIRIHTYFLFHVGRDAGGRPSGPTETLRYMAYYKEHVVKHLTQFECSDPLELDARFAPDRRSISVSFADVRYETEVDQSYLRYLYVLAWADNIGPFRASVRLQLR